MASLYSLTYLQQLCQKYRLYPSKKYGQNFLINPEPIEKMIEITNLSKDDVVVEVGPGFGVLTLPLSEKVRKVYSFEIEKKLQPYWEEQIKKYPNVEVVWGNILRQFDAALIGAIHQLPLHQKGAGQPYKLIANLPYQITSPVIRLFLEAEHPAQMMVLMVQKEVAERICARPGKMSLLSVAVQLYSKPEYITTVPKSCFWPIPQVDSAIIKLDQIKIPSGINQEEFFRVVKAGFSSRRKMLFKNILPILGKENKNKLEIIYKELRLSEKVRAQELAVEEWKQLVERITCDV